MALDSSSKGFFWVLLCFLFVAVAVLRIVLAFSSPFVDYEGFGTLRQVQHIRDTGLPLVDDPLVFGGTQRVGLPFFDYLLVLFSFVFPQDLLVKVLPNVLASLIVFPAFLFCRQATGDSWYGLAGALVTGFVPGSFLVGLNDGSSLGLLFVGIVLCLYLFIKSRPVGRHLRWLLVVLAIICLLHPLSVLFIAGLLVYIALLRLFRLKMTDKELEVSLLALLFWHWLVFLVFKPALQMHGLSVVWQNIPAVQLQLFFSELTLVQAIAVSGFFPLIGAVVGVYVGLVSKTRKSVLLLFSLIIVSVVLLWFRLIPLQHGLAFLAIVIALSSVFGLRAFVQYLRKTRVARFSSSFAVVLLLLYVVVAVSSLSQFSLIDAPSAAEVEVLSWLGQQDDMRGAVLSPPVQGDMVALLADKPTVIDDEYLLAVGVQERYDDVLTVYRAAFKTDAISVMQKYDARFLFLSAASEDFSGVFIPSYLEGDDCFRLRKDVVFDGVRASLFERECSFRGGDR